MLLTLLSLLPGFAAACGDRAQIPFTAPHLQPLLTPPSSPLVWGDFNVIHTTDTHGWLLGHNKASWPEPNYSGTLGDFASFVTHMKQIADEKNVDLLLVDSGDLHDGTGLSDGYPPGGVDGHESDRFLLQLPYDLMTIGNHELYDYDVTYDMYTNFIPWLNGRYLASNVNITITLPSGTSESVPVANRSVTFKTAKGRQVTSLGVIFNFTGFAANTHVQQVSNMVKETWFADAVAEEPDVFLLIGHMPVSNDSWPIVFDAIRHVHPTTPIIILGGHTHIRDCQQYDGRSIALESGRYMETIGWISAELDVSVGNNNSINFTRRYLDQNRVTYEYHTNTSDSTFHNNTFGPAITAGLNQLAAQFNLGLLYGTAPQDYTMDWQDPYPSAGSLLTLFIAEAAPYVLSINNTRANFSNIIISNADVVRYNVFKGNFTKNDQLTAVPYNDSFSYIQDVPAGYANLVLPELNSESLEQEQELWNNKGVERRYNARLAEMYESPLGQSLDLTLGYVTKDGCPDAGVADDTPHIPLPPSYWVPWYISSTPPDVPSDTPIDLVFLSFIESKVLKILNAVQSDVYYTSSDVSQYSPALAYDILGLYAQAKWT